MNNVEKLQGIGILSSVRKEIGAKNGLDPSFDEEINRLSNSELVGRWCHWHLGSCDWWSTMKSYFDELEEMSNDKSEN